MGALFPAALSAYTINGSTVTLAASDQTADNTALIQGFLNNTAYTKIIIPPGPNNASWPVCPLSFNHGNTEIHLNTNTVLEAKAGGYLNGGSCVLTATNLSNIQVTGDTGSEILMHKEEYALLAAAEWRHALNFMSCSNVTVSGLILANTGGDGIYLGDVTGTGYCSNVTITNTIIDGAARNGLSVISVDGLNITNCTFKYTQSQGNVAVNGPWAGIDLEPNNSSERLKNIVIDNCSFLNNKYGFLQWGMKFSGATGALNVTVNNCIMQNNEYGIEIGHIPASLNGNYSVAFKSCSISDNKNMGIYVPNKSRDAGLLSFTDCYLKNNNLYGSSTPIGIWNLAGNSVLGGNVQLNNIVVEQPTNRSVSYFLRVDGAYGSIDNIFATIYASGGVLSVVNSPTNINVAMLPNDAQNRWKMDETSGNTAYDNSGNCNGTLLNNPALTIGRIGGGLSLNGINQFAVVANDATLNIGTGDFSISLWMQRSDNAMTNKRLLYKGASATTEIGYALTGSNTELDLVLCNGVNRIYAGCSIPSLNQWHHIVFTVNRVSGKVMSYLNGVSQASTDISAYNGVDITNTRDLLIGAASSAGYLAWPGAVDDVRIYKRVLSSEEVTQLHSATP